MTEKGGGAFSCMLYAESVDLEGFTMNSQSSIKNYIIIETGFLDFS